jgi:hypothetical protein
MLISAKSLLFTSVEPINYSMIVIYPILSGCGIQSEFMATDAFHECNDYHIDVTQLGQRIAWMYRL